MAKILTSDVLIVGGGLVGMTAALALAKGGLTSTVIDAQKLERTLAPSFDGRASAIASASAQMFKAIDLWPQLADHAQPITDIRVTDGDAPLFLHFDGRVVSDEPLGFMFENRRLRKAMLDRQEQTPAIGLQAPDRIVDWSRDAGGVSAKLASGNDVRASLLIAADGRSSAIREQLGIRCARWDYDQAAIITVVAHERPHDGIAHERFLPAGPFAILPLQGNRAGIVWTVDARDAELVMGLSEAAFTAEIADRFGDFLGKLQVIAPRWTYPLTFHNAERYCDDRVVLVGDSAHGMHPIAGQGLNLGLRDVAALAEVLTDSSRLGLDLGSKAVVERYQQWRRTDGAILLSVTDGLNRLFSTRSKVIAGGRRLGLATVNRVAPLKTFLMQHARGTIGDLPRLLKGQPL
jgi:2-octaprenyl-6-methoxyphenol hydroxylase